MDGTCKSNSSACAHYALAPEFILRAEGVGTNSDLDAPRTTTPSNRPRCVRAPFGELTNIATRAKAKLCAEKNHFIMPVEDPMFVLEQQTEKDSKTNNVVEDHVRDTSAKGYPLASGERVFGPSNFVDSVERNGNDSWGSIATPPMSPAQSNPNSTLEKSRVSCGSSSVRRSSNASSSVMSYFASSPDSHMSRSPDVESAPSPGPDFEIEEQIGVGGFGTVHRVRDLRTDTRHAMKLNRKKSTALREIQLMKVVNHPNVISCFEVVNERNVVMDLMDCDLKKVIGDQSIDLAEIHVKGIAFQIMMGIAAIHRQGFVHRDVTPANVLLNSSTGVVKLSDFGISRTVGRDGNKLTPVCTTLAYRAPEGLHGSRTYTHAVDVWSVGCVVAEMFERKELFPGLSEFDMIMRVLQGLGNPSDKTLEGIWRARAKKKTWVDVCALPWMVQCAECPGAIAHLVPSASPTAHKLLQRLLRLDPRQRPSGEEALADNFFDSVKLETFDPSSLPFVEKWRSQVP